MRYYFPIRPLRARRHAQSGFTLVEAAVAMVIMGLIFAGTIDLFLSATKISGKANAQVASSQDSANAVQHIIEKTREAQALHLPDDAGFTALAGYPAIATNYEATFAGATVDTALEVSAPGTQTPSVLSSSGATVTLAAYDRSTSSGYTLYYRGNANGAPNPASGAYLWEYSSVAGTTIARCKTLDTTAANAVQFVQPSGGATQVEVKIISAAYSLLSGQQTNEETGGTQSSELTGKCVLMRDYSSNNTPSSDASSIAHPFQPG
jgi:prepilin-type N-terminal cleavage/methylation domain-containing protein